MNKQVSDVQGNRKSLRENLGDLANADATKVTAAKRQLASIMNEDPTTFESLDNDAIEARATEYAAQLNAREQALGKFSEKLAVKTASKKPFTSDEKEALALINSGLTPSESAPVGKVIAAPIEKLKFTDAMKAVSADPKLGEAFKAYIDKISNTPFFSRDPEEIDIIQKKVASGRVNELTTPELKLINEYKDDKGNSLLNSFFQQKVKVDGKPTTLKSYYEGLVKASVEKKDYDTLSKLAPKSVIGVANFGGN
jgi:hypothetical protein